jgi:hypothetical protein
MNTETLARKYGKPMQAQYAEVEYLFTLEGIEALIAAEREACIRIAKQWDADHPTSNYGACIARRISAREQV